MAIRTRTPAIAVTPDPDVAVAETHVSVVFFSAERAYKLLKPVSFPFLDFSDRATRIRAADREMELNRRFAPDVYCGSADVREGDEVVDRMIVMRRMPTSRRLTSLVDHGDFLDCLRSVARAVAGFHAAASPILSAPMATRDAVKANWVDNFTAIAPFVDSVIDSEEQTLVHDLAMSYLSNREALFDHRIDHGFIRDGHGDLTAEDIFCLDDGPRILDCLAFSDELRIGDVLNDVAFLVMDVHRLAGQDAATSLMTWYREFSNTHHPASLAHHYVAYRAHVRTKIACLRWGQGDLASADLARTYHRLALHHLERARVRLILVGGGAGTGKSTLAENICDHFGYVRLASDEIRKDLTGTAHDEHRFAEPGAGIYRPEMVDATYREQCREAELLLAMGQGVVLDASWTSAQHRALARETARRCGAELVEIECAVDPAIARERIARRMLDVSNPSDATPEVVDFMAARRDPWPTATRLSTAVAQGVVTARAVAHITNQPIRFPPATEP